MKILTGICIANFASSCSDISDRVSQLSMSFPFKMPVKHLIMPAYPHLNSFLSFPAHWPALHFLKVYAAGTLYEVNLDNAMAFVRRYLLLHKAAAMGMRHPATLSALQKVSCHDTFVYHQVHVCHRLCQFPFMHAETWLERLDGKRLTAIWHQRTAWIDHDQNGNTIKHLLQ